MDEIRFIIHEEWSNFLTLSELAALTRTDRDQILIYSEYGLVTPVGRADSEPGFELDAIQKIRTIRRLREELGVNLAGIAVIMELLEKLKRLQAEVDWLR